jgi:hypothetical protein
MASFSWSIRKSAALAFNAPLKYSPLMPIS